MSASDEIVVDTMDRSHFFDNPNIGMNLRGYLEFARAVIELTNLKTYTVSLRPNSDTNKITQFLDQNKIIRYRIFTSKEEKKLTLTFITTSRKHQLVHSFLKTENFCLPHDEI